MLKLIFFCCFFPIILQGQNLISNPSFETTNGTFCGLMYASDFNSTAQDWQAPSSGSTDLYFTNISTACFNYQPSSQSTYSGPIGFKGDQLPRTGNVMAGFYAYTISSFNQREYAQIQLSSPMVVGEAYVVEFYVSAADFSEFFGNSLGALLSENSVSIPNGSVIAETPQIKADNFITDVDGWTRVFDTIVAQHPYEYLTLGNFEDDNNTGTTSNPTASFLPGTYGVYYFIDDVRVQQVQRYAGPDIPTAISGTSPVSLPNAFTPNSDDINDRFKPTGLETSEIAAFSIYNRMGQEIFNSKTATDFGWDGTFKGVPQAQDLYFYVLAYQKKGSSTADFKKGSFTLLR